MILIPHRHFVLIGVVAITCSASFADEKREILEPANARALRGPVIHATVDRDAAPSGTRIVEQIRNALSSDEKLSVAGKNVKLIATPEGRVTLEGAVGSADEKNKIAFLAAKIAGPGMVENQLSIKASK